MKGSASQYPDYPPDFRMAIRLALPMIFSLRRSFQQDAQRWVKQLKPAPVIIGVENIPQGGPFLLVINHYYRPKYKAWWSVLAASAIVPCEIHWVMAAAWTFPNHPFGRFLEGISRIVFKRLARIYDFSQMPPMPPRPWEVEARALAVRKILAYVHKNGKAAIGLAPEGGDSPSGALEMPASGVGRFISHLAHSGLAIYPAGIYESNGLLHLIFGKALNLDPSQNMMPKERDEWGKLVVMQAIAELLPQPLQGPFYSSKT